MPVSRVSDSASAFMWATMSGRPSWASVTTAVIRPAASKRGEKTGPSSSAVLSAEGCGNENFAIVGPWCGAIGGSGPSVCPELRREAHLPLALVPARADDGRRHRGRALLANAAHGHEHVLGLDHHGDAAGI